MYILIERGFHIDIHPLLIQIFFELEIKFPIQMYNYLYMSTNKYFLLNKKYQVVFISCFFFSFFLFNSILLLLVYIYL